MQGEFRVILRNGIDIITTMIVQNTIFTTYFFRMDSFDGWTFPLVDAEKKSVEPLSSRANLELPFEMGSTLSLQ